MNWTNARRHAVQLVNMRIGTDVLAIAVSAANEFVTGLSQEQLKVLFGGVELWSGLESTWPAQPVMRFVPGADSGTLDFLVEHVYGDLALTDLPRDVLEAAVANSVSAACCAGWSETNPWPSVPTTSWPVGQ